MNVSYDDAVNEVAKLAKAKFELRLDKAKSSDWACIIQGSG